MITANVGRRGQITLPRALRHWLKIQEGDHVACMQRGGEVIMQPLTQTLFDLRGSIPVSGSQDFTAIRRQVKETQARKVVEDAE